MYFLSFSSIFSRFALYIFRERKKESIRASAVMAQLEALYNGKFDEATRKKVIKSHSVYNPLIIDAFCLLHGRVSNEHERKMLVYYFVCSSLLDNFFDRNELTNQQIHTLCFDVTNYVASSFDENVFIYCHRYLLENINDPASYLTVLKNEVRAQEASMQQFQKDISSAIIESIMQAKGGNAVLLCHYYLDLNATATEEQCWYQLGVIIQLSNDLYDIYKDMNDGIETLANRCTNAHAMETYATAEVNKLQQLIAQLPFNKKIKQRFSVSMAGVCALAGVGIDQLKTLQGTQDQLPEFRSLPRKQLIVDMEKPANIIRWLKYVYRYGKIKR